MRLPHWATRAPRRARRAIQRSVSAYWCHDRDDDWPSVCRPITEHLPWGMFGGAGSNARNIRRQIPRLSVQGRQYPVCALRLARPQRRRGSEGRVHTSAAVVRSPGQCRAAALNAFLATPLMRRRADFWLSHGNLHCCGRSKHLDYFAAELSH